MSKKTNETNMKSTKSLICNIVFSYVRAAD